MSHVQRSLLELWIVLRSVWLNVALFIGVIVGAAALLQWAGCYPQTSFQEQLVNAFYLSRLESVPGSPHLLLTVLTFVMPLLALFILGEGALRVAAIYLGRRQHREEWEKLMASTLSGHTVLCGAGELGRTLLQELLGRRPELQVVIVDTHSDVLHELGMHGANLHHIHGDMTSRETLEMANVQQAAIVLITSGNDAHNLETAFKVHRLNPNAQIHIRLYRRGLTEIMDTTARPNIHFFSPYQREAEALAEELAGKG